MANNEKYQENQKESQQKFFKEEQTTEKNPTVSGLAEKYAVPN